MLPGQEVSVEIEGIGTLRNSITADQPRPESGE